MATELISTPNGYIEIDRRIPGTVSIEGVEIVYFSDNGTKNFRKQFLALGTKIKPYHQTGGGLISEACRIHLPDDKCFHGISYRGDIEGWRRQIEEGAKALSVLLGNIQGDSIVLSDGRSFALADCKIEFD